MVGFLAQIASWSPQCEKELADASSPLRLSVGSFFLGGGKVTNSPLTSPEMKKNEEITCHMALNKPGLLKTSQDFRMKGWRLG